MSHDTASSRKVETGKVGQHAKNACKVKHAENCMVKHAENCMVKPCRELQVKLETVNIPVRGFRVSKPPT